MCPDLILLASLWVPPPGGRMEFTMRIGVCAKFAPDADDVMVGPDGTASLSRAKWDVSLYDKQAIQAASDLGELADAEQVALTVGGSNIANTLLSKTLLSRGQLSELYRIANDSAEALDTLGIARTLAELVKRANVDVVICGEGSSDRYSRTTAAQMAEVLGWPCVTSVDAISFSDGAIVCDRNLEDGIDVVEVQAPCVIAVTSTVNVPPIPKMKAALAAGKKPVIDVEFADLAIPEGGMVRTSSHEPEEPGRKRIVFDGTPDEAAAKLVKALLSENVI